MSDQGEDWIWASDGRQTITDNLMTTTKDGTIIPLSGVWVCLYQEQAVGDNHFSFSTTVTDSTGKFTIPDVASGVYKVAYAHDRQGPWIQIEDLSTVALKGAKPGTEKDEIEVYNLEYEKFVNYWREYFDAR